MKHFIEIHVDGDVHFVNVNQFSVYRKAIMAAVCIL